MANQSGLPCFLSVSGSLDDSAGVLGKAVQRGGEGLGEFLANQSAFDQYHRGKGSDRYRTLGRTERGSTSLFVVDTDVPGTLGQRDSFFGIRSAEDHKQLVGGLKAHIPTNTEGTHMGIFAGDRDHVGENVVDRGHPKDGVCLTECDQSLIIFESPVAFR